MAGPIHARRTEDGRTVFREWLTVVDAYGTEEGDRDAMREYLLVERHGDPGHPPARARALEEIEERLARAEARGTSQIGEARDLRGPWDAERSEWDERKAGDRG